MSDELDVKCNSIVELNVSLNKEKSISFTEFNTKLLC
jgi:hypothetical protein